MTIPSLGISINTKDYYNKNNHVHIKFSFTPKQLVFQKENNTYYIPYPKDFPLENYREKEVLSALINSFECEESLKAELQHYLS